mmetsp:Transcript_17666/g.53859  ORF Transcript_17666/g.53859 Transcript_17666/m.53859 type:complete len:237 (+) Transcript_17666:324-1034(+)
MSLLPKALVRKEDLSDSEATSTVPESSVYQSKSTSRRRQVASTRVLEVNLTLARSAVAASRSGLEKSTRCNRTFGARGMKRKAIRNVTSTTKHPKPAQHCRGLSLMRSTTMPGTFATAAAGTLPDVSSCRCVRGVSGTASCCSDATGSGAPVAFVSPSSMSPSSTTSADTTSASIGSWLDCFVSSSKLSDDLWLPTIFGNCTISGILSWCTPNARMRCGATRPKLPRSGFLCPRPL